jgi:hypothetical protein
MTAINNDADFYDPAEAFLDKWTKDAKEPSEDEEQKEDTEDTTDEDAETEGEATEPEGEVTEPEEAPDDGSDEEETDDDDSRTDEGSESEAEDEGEEADDDSSDVKKTLIESDDAYVKIKVDGKEVEASIKDLKRLYGQEAALTRKSQEAADIRKQAETAGAMHVAGLEAMLNMAKKEAEPYAKLNFLALTKDPNITQEELEALSNAAQSSYEKVRFLESELDGVIKHHEKTRRDQMMTQAKETHKALSDPKTGIEGWGETLYNDIRQFAMEQGLEKRFVDEIVDPVGIKIIHMAMQYAKGKKAVSGKSMKKVDKSPKKIVKGQSADTVGKGKAIKKDAAIKRLQHSGSVDDAAEAFLARWSDKS